MPASTEGDETADAGDEPRPDEDEPRSLAPGPPARTVLDFLVEHPEESFAPDEFREGGAAVDGRPGRPAGVAHGDDAGSRNRRGAIPGSRLGGVDRIH